ncbi:hypothetical protein V7S43_008972 [Phytophthora oleae]|uniref:Ankyrin repeat protein n=1 Tax=Phytophthora oleae TaxID=2107226 RepID=A0ABD3FME4_9STRA
MKIAAAYGRLGIVRFLYENRSEGNIGEALYAAAMYGQNNVARYLSALVHEKEGSDALICEAAQVALKYGYTELSNMLGCQRLQS